MAIIQKEPFVIEDIINNLRHEYSSIGAVVSFVGYVREFSNINNKAKLEALHIEHYPAMTQNELLKIEDIAKKKWDIEATQIIHRVGELKVNEIIVGVIVLSKHRDEAFDACRFIIDYLKTEAPFWKKEITSKGSYWVEKNEQDNLKTKKWQEIIK